MFEKFELWTFKSPSPSDVFTSSWKFWGQRGYQLQQIGPTSFQGRSFQSKIGIHRVVDITIQPSGADTVVNLRYRADVRADVAAGGVVVAVLLLPVAVVGAAVSWHEYESDWSRERWDYWNFLSTEARVQPASGSFPPPLPSAGSPPPAPAGHAPTPPSSTSAVDASSPPLPGSGSGNSICPVCKTPATGERKFCASCGAAIPP